MAKLRCVECGYEQNLPMHCGGPMTVSSNMLVCQPCGFETQIPIHCGKTMVSS